MAWKSTDEFWNTSSGTSFNFDDDFERESSQLLNNDFMSNNNSNSLLSYNLYNSNTQNILPVHSLLTERNLDAVVDDIRITTQMIVPSVQETIIKMFLGKPYSLTVYRSLNQKLELLDEAVASDDGNIILAVLLFLKKTLELPELYFHLAKRKIAFRHYFNYLMEELLLQDLSDLCLQCGCTFDLIYLYYVSLEKALSKDKIHLKLLGFLLEYQMKLSSDKNAMFIDYKNFVKWQIDNNASCDTVTEQLAALCKLHWEYSSDNNNVDKQISEFKVFVKMGNFQYEWVVVNALCALKMWKKLKSVFIKPNWLTKRNSLKSVISAQLFISILSKHNAPIEILEDFLSCVVDTELSLSLGKKLSCHNFVINLYVSQRDRLAIQSYKLEIPRESEYYDYAERVLASDKKWKN